MTSLSKESPAMQHPTPTGKLHGGGGEELVQGPRRRNRIPAQPEHRESFGG